ncbi:MAG: hypothetical protein L6365_19785, partial [Desulfobulbaceae bacterium]|nr:hypothetical protein [Pseudomonadota bacterium]MCG2749757.1 hypothetical protein [Desulfobulbaceae bacterium]
YLIKIFPLRQQKLPSTRASHDYLTNSTSYFFSASHMLLPRSGGLKLISAINFTFEPDSAVS